LIPDLLSI
jgi:hypothetical protein